jgi:ribosomal protein L37AE/L43A|tara:strand:- start:582 stop:779 length:198 start_codon:yes stop_codon:yes gene_type:complete
VVLIKFKYDDINFYAMGPDKDWKEQLDKFKVVQRCPKCSSLSLKFVEGKLKCSECSFEQDMKSIE